MANKFIVCADCKAEHELENILQEREVRPDLLEVGLSCTCGVWTHSYFTTAALKAQSLKAHTLLQAYHAQKTPVRWQQYETARDAYSRQFTALNRRWRRKFGMLVKDGSRNDNKSET